MVPDNDPDEHEPAANQMCTKLDKDGSPIADDKNDDNLAAFNIDRCGQRAQAPDPDDPRSEVLPEGRLQDVINPNDTVSLAL